MFHSFDEASDEQTAPEPSRQARELDEIALRLAILNSDSEGLTGRLARLRGALEQAVGAMKQPPLEW